MIFLTYPSYTKWEIIENDLPLSDYDKIKDIFFNEKIKIYMGNFYSNCSITNMTLTGGAPVARILLIPTSYSGTYDSRNYFKSTRFLNSEGSLGIFSPFGFPIFGEYWNYGKLENINRDDNVLMLEKYFEMSIEDIFEYIQTSNKSTNSVLDILTFTDIGAEIYTFLSERPISSWNSDYFDKDVKDFFEDENYEINIPIGFIPFLCKNNFLQIFGKEIREKMMDDYTKMQRFVWNMNGIDKKLIPSVYGGQEKNFELLMELNLLANRLMKNNDRI